MATGRSARTSRGSTAHVGNLQNIADQLDTSLKSALAVMKRTADRSDLRGAKFHLTADGQPFEAIVTRIVHEWDNQAVQMGALQ